MPATRPLLALVLCSFLVCSHSVPAPAKSADQPGKVLTLEDLYRLDHPQTSILSPDGKHLAYIRHWFDGAFKQERHSLWLVDSSPEKAKPLEAGEPDARSPVFSPDGQWIAFLSTRSRPEGWKPTPPAPPESDPATDLWLISVHGGPAIPLAGPDKPYGRVFNDGFYGRLAFSPGGRKLAFIADDGKDPRTPEEIAANVLIVRPDQGEGYTGYGPAQLWIADLDPASGKTAAGKIERLTRDNVWYGDPQWSPDGRSLVVHANKTADRESARYSINKNFDIWQMDLQTRQFRQLTSGPGPEVCPRYAPDGKRLVCLSIPRKGTHRDVFNLAVVTLGEGGARTEILFDHHRPDAGQAPHPSPSFPLPVDCWDGNDGLVYQTAAGTDTQIIRVQLKTGQGKPLADVTKEQPQERHSYAGRLALRQRLTPPGDRFLQERRLGETRLIRWKSEDGNAIDGLLTLPPDFVARPPYKLLLHPHGGPHSRTSRGFNFPVQFFAASGYAVFQPNFRGSEGYGQTFIDADRSDFGGGDVRDILSGIDHLVAEKLIDKGRQFVYGSSYGGFLTCWLVGHTQQFRAAVAQNAVTDLTMMWGLSDLPSWVEWEFGGRPWEVPGAMRQHSPLSDAGNVRTPTLILHSREDRRCPIPMGQLFYRVLLAQKVPTQMVIYPGEGHGIRQPRHQEDVLRRTLAWFQKYDRGSPKTER